MTFEMLLGQIPVTQLKNISAEMWNGPLDSGAPRFFIVEVVGVIEDFHADTVRCSGLEFVVVFLMICAIADEFDFEGTKGMFFVGKCV
jgi:hypothetical protein